jgi:AraC-like DNA-binding protein
MPCASLGVAQTEKGEFSVNVLAELQRLLERHATGSIKSTQVPGLALMRADAVSSCAIAAVYSPMVCIIAQGSKQVVVGNATLDYDPGNYLISSVDLPVSGRVTSATPEHPYLALGLQLDPKLLAAVFLELPEGRAQTSLSRGVAVSPVSSELLEAFARLLRLLDAPADIPPLAPLVVREIFYRLLTGEQASMLRQIALPESRLPQVIRVVEWIRNNYARPLHIGQLARLAHMSPASLHRQFKAVTAMSPLQYQKQVRLQEAQYIMVSRDADAASAGFAVGYGSPSQFSREYHRMFGTPPRQHTNQVRSEREL